GAVSETEHFNVGVHLAENGIDNLITVGTQAKFIADGACSVNPNITVFCTENNEQAAEILRKLLTPNCAVLVKGSRGMHTDYIVQGLLHENLCN
ncbi:MAG: UDP-N-acetylmuramoyl-tripeptide--D-alanyl-D-alanine ligase, partial [Acutalibacteraceae bacterium]